MQLEEGRDRFIEAGLFDEQLPARQDYEAWLRCLKFGLKAIRIDEVLTQINVETEQKSISKSLARNEEAMKVITTKYQEDLAELSPASSKARLVNIDQFFIHKCLTVKDYKKGFALSVTGFLKHKKLSFLVSAVLMILGLKAFLRVWKYRNG